MSAKPQYAVSEKSGAVLEAWFERELGRQPASADDDEALARLTIVIPTYNRRNFVLRQLIHWHGSRANVVIVDGSDEPLPEEIRTTIGGWRNVRYIHAALGMHDRLRLAIPHIATPYVVMQGDDEFFIKSGLRKAIARLDDDSVLAACNGQSVGFRCGAAGVEYYDAGYAHRGYAVLGETAPERLRFAMASYNAATCYAVLRAPAWKAGWGDLHAWSSPYAGELYQAVATYLVGKLDTIDELLLLRSGENPPVSDASRFNRKLQFRDWWRSPRYEAERQDFLDRLTAKAVATSKIGNEAARGAILEALAAYVDLCERTAPGGHMKAARNMGRLALATALNAVLPRARVLALKEALCRVAGRPGAMSPESGLGSTRAELDGIEALIFSFHETFSGDAKK